MNGIESIGSYIDNTLTLAKNKQGSNDIARLEEGFASATAPKTKQEIEQKAKEFEAVFLNQMFSIMFDGIEPDALFGGGRTEEIFQSFLIEEHAKVISNRGGIGLAEHITKELLALQEIR